MKSSSIQSDWEVTTLGSLMNNGVLQCLNGYSSGTHNQDGDGIPHVRPFNISPEGHSTIEQLKYIPEVCHKDTYSLHHRDVIFNNTNTEELVGKTASWRHHGLYGFSNHMTRIRVSKLKEMNPEFLAFYLHFHWQTGRSRQLCRRHVSQASIMGDRFNQIPVPKPPQLEQEKIAFILTKIQQAIEVETDLIRVSRELKAAVMKKLFSEGLNGESQKETEIGLVPESWSVCGLGEVAKFQGGFAFKSTDYVNEGIKLLRISNVSFGVSAWDELALLPAAYADKYKEFLLSPGDIVMAMTRPIVSGGIKVVTLTSEDAPALLNQRVGRFKLTSKLHDRFMYHLIFSNNFVNAISLYADGSQQPNISAGQIERIHIPIPPTCEEQVEIASKLDQLDLSISTHVRKRDTLKEVFSNLLTGLMSAAIRTEDLKIDATCHQSQGVAA